MAKTGNNPNVLLWVLKQTLLHLPKGTIQSNKKEQTANICNNLDFKGTMLSEKVNLKDGIFYNFTYRTFLK